VRFDSRTGGSSFSKFFCNSLNIWGTLDVQGWMWLEDNKTQFSLGWSEDNMLSRSGEREVMTYTMPRTR
jgi:hypothetical protein